MTELGKTLNGIQRRFSGEEYDELIADGGKCNLTRDGWIKFRSKQHYAMQTEIRGLISDKSVNRFYEAVKRKRKND